MDKRIIRSKTDSRYYWVLLPHKGWTDGVMHVSCYGLKRAIKELKKWDDTQKKIQAKS